MRRIMRPQKPFLVRVRGRSYVRTSYTDHSGKRRDRFTTIREDETFDDAARRLLENMNAEKLDRNGYIYALLEVGRDALIKLGWSKKPWQRFGQIQAGNPRQLILLCYWPAAGGTKEETRLKSEFAFCGTRTPRKRMLGEWFHPHPRLVAFLKRRAAAHDAVDDGISGLVCISRSLTAEESDHLSKMNHSVRPRLTAA
jgi:hypothetical protein